MYYIYKIENLVNHKKYIGLTNNIARIRARYFTDLHCNKHDNKFLQKEFNIYGKDNFSFNIEFQGDVSYQEIGEKEREYIKNMIVIIMDIIRMKVEILARQMVEVI